MPSPGAHAAPPRRRRLRASSFVAAGLCLLALLGWQVVHFLPDRSPAPETAAGGGAAAAGTPRTLTETTVLVGDDGSLHTMETLTLRPGTSRLDLSVPDRAGAAAQMSPRVSSLVVRGAHVTGAPTRLAHGARATVELPAGARRVVLEYDVTGVVQRSGPAHPERALVLVTPLVVAQTRAAPSRVHVPSVKVLNVGCLRASGELVGCGTHTEPGWTVESSGGVEGVQDVVAQVDLATP
jgi:hypothetical protein